MIHLIITKESSVAMYKILEKSTRVFISVKLISEKFWNDYKIRVSNWMNMKPVTIMTSLIKLKNIFKPYINDETIDDRILLHTFNFFQKCNISTKLSKLLLCDRSYVAFMFFFACFFSGVLGAATQD